MNFAPSRPCNPTHIPACRPPSKSIACAEAVTAYRTATDLDPSNQKAKYGLGRMLKEIGQTDEGEALMAAALAADATAGETADEGMIAVRVAG